MQSIDFDEDVLAGKPIIRGTRISVQHILSLLASGLSVQDICSEHPQLTEASVRDAIRFAADAMNNEEFIIDESSH